jgi:hypothetical protein
MAIQDGYIISLVLLIVTIVVGVIMVLTILIWDNTFADPPLNIVGITASSSNPNQTSISTSLNIVSGQFEVEYSGGLWVNNPQTIIVYYSKNLDTNSVTLNFPQLLSGTTSATPPQFSTSAQIPTALRPLAVEIVSIETIAVQQTQLGVKSLDKLSPGQATIDPTGDILITTTAIDILGTAFFGDFTVAGFQPFQITYDAVGGTP